MEQPAPGGDAFEVTIDPFGPRLAFAHRLGMQLRTASDRGAHAGLKLLDTRVDKFINIEKLEALAQFEGLIRSPRVKRPDEYPDALIDALRIKEPQFILRSLRRVERYADPNENLPLEVSVADRGSVIGAYEGTGISQRASLELLEKMTYDLVGEQRNWFKWLYDEAQWERYFSREIREKHTGPMWAYDPDAPTQGEEEDAQ